MADLTCLIDIFCCLMIAPVFWMVVGLWRVWFAWPALTEQASRWGMHSSASGAWKQVPCHIHDLGISNRGGCHEVGPPVDMGGIASHFSECPGVAWCADEGETCDCLGGDVTMAPASYQWNLPDYTQSATLTDVQGPVTCGVQGRWVSAGDFPSDPAPLTTKVCFCKPQAIKQLIAQFGDIDPAASSTCHSQANTDFAQQKWSLPDGRCDNAGNHMNYDVFNGQYRVYMPWTLVELKTPATEMEPASSTLRCAWPYGAPQASREYNTDRLQGFWDTYSSYTMGSADHQCWVRTDSFDQDACAVSLEDPATLAATGEGSFGLHSWPVYFIGSYPIVLCCGLVLFRTLRNRRRDSHFEGSSSENSDSEALIAE